MTTTLYYLGVLNNSAPEIRALIPIEKEEHDCVRELCFRVVAFLEQQSFALVSRNHTTLTTALETAQDLPNTGNVETIRVAFFELRLMALDWLLATRLFLDHTRYELSDKLGRDSSGLKAWDEARRSEHSQHVGYRILNELRDYCTHRGMPPLDFHATGDVSGTGTFNATIDPRKLLDSFEWKKQVRTDLSAMRGPVQFGELAAEFMECLTRLAELAQRLLAPNVLADASGLLRIADRVSNLGGHPAVFLMRFENATDHPEYVSPTPLPIDAARYVLSIFAT